MSDFVIEAIENFVIERWYLIALIVAGYLLSIWWKGRNLKREKK